VITLAPLAAVSTDATLETSDFDKKEIYLDRLFARISAPQQAKVREFLDDLRFQKGLSTHARRNYLRAILSLEEVVQKPYENLTKEDISLWLEAIIKKYAPRHVRKLKVSLKRFVRWQCNGDDREKPDPACIRGLRVGRDSICQPKDILSFDELRAMLGKAENLEHRSLLFVLYDCGGRAAEVCGLKIGDAEFDRYGAIIRVKEKRVRGRASRKRPIRLVLSVPDLRQWLSHHPKKDDRDALIWSVTSTRLWYLVKKYAKLAGINKNIGPHSFRHSRATHLASVLTEAQLRIMFGWSKNSEMPAVYVHLSQRDVDPTLLKHYGIKLDEGTQENEILMCRKCPRCDFENSALVNFCTRCAAPLDPKVVMDLDARSRRTDELTARVVEELVRRAPGLLKQILEETELGEQIAEAGKGEVIDDGSISHSR
jgi:site-specific recombinase XerD